MINWIIRLFKQAKGHGLDFSKVKIDPDHDFQFGDGKAEARFGAAEVIRPDGQWDEFLPIKEIQRFDWGDTMHCTVYGTENCEQTLIKAKYNEFTEYTERYLGVLAGISQNGGSPHQVMEQRRKNGNLEYHELPFENVNSFSQFNSPKPMTQSLINKGKVLLETFKFGHQWITVGLVGDMASSMKAALKHSPIGVGVYAWNQEGDYYTKPSWARDNHWVMCYGYVEGKYWKIFDHYDNVKKKVAWNYPWAFAKSITVIKIDHPKEEAGRLLYNRLKGMHIIRSQAHGEIYEVGDTINYEGWWSNSSWLQEQLGLSLQEQERRGNFIGISENDFENLTTYANFAGIKMDDGAKVAGQIDKLKKLNN
jgi:hypothetical protein